MVDEDEAESHSKIVDMFHTENDGNLPRYKRFIVLREEIDVGFKSDYRSLAAMEAKVKADPELEKKLFRVVDIL